MNLPLHFLYSDSQFVRCERLIGLCNIYIQHSSKVYCINKQNNQYSYLKGEKRVFLCGSYLDENVNRLISLYCTLSAERFLDDCIVYTHIHTRQ